MSNPIFTPEHCTAWPWFFDRVENKVFGKDSFIGSDKMRQKVCSVGAEGLYRRGASMGDLCIEVEANGHMIAAAPELFEACQDVLNAYQQMFDAMPVAFQTTIHTVEAALAKAKGGAR